MVVLSSLELAERLHLQVPIVCCACITKKNTKELFVRLCEATIITLIVQFKAG